jgi:hypothetical protein
MKPVVVFFDAFPDDKNFFESHLKEQFELVSVEKGLRKILKGCSRISLVQSQRL